MAFSEKVSVVTFVLQVCVHDNQLHYIYIREI